MLEHIGDVVGASFCQDDVKNAQNRSKLLEIARILSFASARTQICVLTVCQQQHWQVLEHCANSRIRVGVGPKSVLTVDVGVLTLERRPWTQRVRDKRATGERYHDNVQRREGRNNEVRRIEREGLEARLGRGGCVVGAMWDEGNMVYGACDAAVWGDDAGVEVWGWVDTMTGPPRGAGHLSHTHPHLLSSPVGEAVQGLLWSLIQQQLLLVLL